jgi:tRNA(Arg) A34 adenosine deaminase TadA
MIGNPPLVFNQIRTLLEARLFKTMEICAICLRTGRHSRVASFLFLM